MIRNTSTTIRDADADEKAVLKELRALDPRWIYVGLVSGIKIFRLTIMG